VRFVNEGLVIQYKRRFVAEKVEKRIFLDAMTLTFVVLPFTPSGAKRKKNASSGWWRGGNHDLYNKSGGG